MSSVRLPHAVPAPTLFAPADDERPPRVLVIAELGVNHDGRLDRALQLVRAAADAGADAVKLQLFDPRHLLSNQARLAEYQKQSATDLFTMLDGLRLSPDDMAAVRDAAHERGLRFVVTLFSVEDLPVLRMLDPDAVKIASPDAVNLPLLRAAASVNKALIVSTGTCEMAELYPAADLLRRHARKGVDVAFLQCVSSYPAPPSDAALGAIRAITERFDLPAGYSDHTQDLLTGAMAVAAGAAVVEKHLTHDRAAPGPDHSASLEPEGFAQYLALIRQAAAMLGPIAKRTLAVEAEVRDVSRQSVCASRDLPAGHVLSPADLTIKRPGTGIPAARFDQTLGKTLARPVPAGNLLTPTDLAA